MIKEIKLPKLSQTMEDAAIVEVLVGIGDEVKKGDNIFEIETDKACVEVRSEQTGFVKHILVESGQTVAVGATVMILADKDEQVPGKLIERLKAKLPRLQELIFPNTPQANEISISFVNEKSKTISNQHIKLGAAIPLSNLQKITAQKMLKSKSEIPSFYLNIRVDVTELAKLREKLNEKANLKLSYNDFFIKAVAAGLKCFPLMAGTLVGEAIQLPETINIGLATSVSDCLYVPVIKQADKKSIQEIAQERVQLVEKAQRHKLAPEDIEGASITISNLGSLGVDSFIPIVIPGQCSIIGIGRIMDQAIPDNDRITVRKMMNLIISVDHRIANGSYASEYLDFVRKYLQDISQFI
jgi:pyruvate dehydrogenase E2 component (dihydrolipoamide acetyltransferase)